MDVSSNLEVTGTAGRQTLVVSRGVSFADALESELSTSSNTIVGEAANSRSGKRLERSSTSEPEPTPAVTLPADNVPAWLMSSVPPDAGEIGSTEDLMDEFLQDHDMINLEVICAKWRGLDQSEIEGISHIAPEVLDSLVLGEKDVQEFLEYRRIEKEKHARKASVQRTISGRRGLEPVAEDGGEKDSELGEEQDHFELGNSDHISETSSNQFGASDGSLELSLSSKRSTIAKDHSQGRESIVAGRRKSMANAGARRMSVAASRLSRAAASQMTGQEEPSVEDRLLTKRATVAARRTSMLGSKAPPGLPLSTIAQAQELARASSQDLSPVSSPRRTLKSFAR